MLAKPFGPKFTRYPCFIQPKFNGVRCLYQYTPDALETFQSRDEKIWDRRFISHLEDELSTLRSIIKDSILDGELYVHGWRLQRINMAMAVNATVRGPNLDTPNIEYHIFDVVDPNLPFADRFLDLMVAIQEIDLPHVRVAQTEYIHSSWQGDAWFKEWCEQGYEGAMYRPNEPYVFGESLTTPGAERRSDALWKRKHWEDAEFLCVGVTQGEGKASNGIGALVCQTAKGKTFHIGTGFDYDYDRPLFLESPPIGHYIKVRFNGKTEDGIPVPASFQCVMPKDFHP